MLSKHEDEAEKYLLLATCKDSEYMIFKDPVVAAEKECVAAMYNIGYFYEKVITELNLYKSEVYHDFAKAKGNSASYYEMGVYYNTTEPHEPYLFSNLNKAIEMGHDLAMFYLGGKREFDDNNIDLDLKTKTQ